MDDFPHELIGGSPVLASQTCVGEEEHSGLDDNAFDNVSRTLVSSVSRRAAVGALAGLLGPLALDAEVGSTSRHKRRHQRKKQHRRRTRRRKQSAQRGIKLLVLSANTNPPKFEVELGFAQSGDFLDHYCCQGQAGYQLEPGESHYYTTESSTAYLWVDNKYFLTFENSFVGKPLISFAVFGADPKIFRADCCKPLGEHVHGFRLEENETKTITITGHGFSVERVEDETAYKSFIVRI